MSDKFDFNVANSLVQAVNATATALDVKNNEMKKHFSQLREGFKDSGYEAFSLDMSMADKSIKEIITQLHEISRCVGDYAARLKDGV